MSTGLTRRTFLKGAGAAAAVTILGDLGFDLTPVALAAQNLRIKTAKENMTVCCFCSVGCGAIVHTSDGKVINIEGDPDNPLNQGTLCSKGEAMYQLTKNKRRVDTVLYRAPGAKDWQTKDWDWAMKEIAKRVKKTRDSSFMEMDEAGITVNRTEAIAQLGGAAHDNEECYLLSKLGRALGIVYMEHQARI